jgi:hypothetical protein
MRGIFEIGNTQSGHAVKQGPVVFVAPFGGGDGENAADDGDLPHDGGRLCAFGSPSSDFWLDQALVDVVNRYAGQGLPVLERMYVTVYAPLVLVGFQISRGDKAELRV